MVNKSNNQQDTFKAHLIELLNGGFAPVVILLREFDYHKAGIVLDGLHFSTWSLLRHMSHRQQIMLQFMRNPSEDISIWPEAYWPNDFQPQNEQDWIKEIEKFESDLQEIISIVEDPEADLYKNFSNGKSLYWAAVANLQHNAYHIGQVKAVGRQLGVW